MERGDGSGADAGAAGSGESGGATAGDASERAGRASPATPSAGPAAGRRLRDDLRRVRRHGAAAAATWAVLAAAVVVGAGGWGERLDGVALVTLLVPIALVDLDARLIPNRLTLPGVVLGLALAAATDPGAAPERALAAAAAGGLLLAAALARPGDLGMGDAKLAALLGAFLGREAAVAVLAGFLLAALAGGALAVRRHPRHRPAGRLTLPLGPFLAAGAVLALLAGEDLVAWYVGSE